jgi:hypothetical protein
MVFSDAPVLSMGNATTPFNTQYLDRTLDQFKIIYGDNVESSTNFRTVKNVGGVNPENNELLFSDASPDGAGDPLREDVSPVLFAEFRTDRVVTNKTIADEAATAAARMSRFGIPAKIKGQGDPRIRPFGAIYVAGTGNLTDGFWSINEARHMFHQGGDYTLELSVSTDGIGDAVVETPFRTRSGSGTGTVDLNSAALYGSAATMSFSMDSVKLTEGSNVNSESNQGYLRTPNRWKSAG